MMFHHKEESEQLWYSKRRLLVQSQKWKLNNNE